VVSESIASSFCDDDDFDTFSFDDRRDRETTTRRRRTLSPPARGKTKTTWVFVRHAWWLYFLIFFLIFSRALLCRCLSILSSIPCRLRLCLGFHYIFFFPCNGRFSLFDQKPKTHTHALLFLFTQVAYKHLKPTTGRDILNLSLSLCLCVCHVVVF